MIDNAPQLGQEAWGDIDTLIALAIHLDAPITVFSSNQHGQLVTTMVSNNVADIEENLLSEGHDV